MQHAPAKNARLNKLFCVWKGRLDLHVRALKRCILDRDLMDSSSTTNHPRKFNTVEIPSWKKYSFRHLDLKIMGKAFDYGINHHIMETRGMKPHKCSKQSEYPITLLWAYKLPVYIIQKAFEILIREHSNQSAILLNVKAVDAASFVCIFRATKELG